MSKNANAPTAKKKAAKKTTKKAAPRKQTAPSGPLELGAVVKTSKLKFVPRSRRSKQYNEVIDRMLSLKPDPEGQSFSLNTPGISPRVIHNRLNAAFRRTGILDKAPKGYQFTKRTEDETNRVIISLEPIKGVAPVKG